MKCIAMYLACPNMFGVSYTEALFDASKDFVLVVNTKNIDVLSPECRAKS
jgi:hypothetical protein